MHKHLEKMGEVTFDKIFHQKLGKFLCVADFAPGQMPLVTVSA
jgi:hypothetical protein